jgi:hypothetical protein
MSLSYFPFSYALSCAYDLGFASLKELPNNIIQRNSHPHLWDILSTSLFVK